MAARIQKATDPFYEPPLPRAYYHPSPLAALTGNHPKMVESPQRGVTDHPQKPLTPEEEAFLRGSYQYNYGPGKGVAPSTQEADRYGRIGGHDDSAKFNESWPDSERLSSPPSIPPTSMYAHSQRDKSRGSVSTISDIRSRIDFSVQEDIDHDDKRPQQDLPPGSTLSKYIERFRHGKPLSKDERRSNKGASQRDFWWLDSAPASSLATPPSSSTPKEEESTNQRTGRPRVRGRVPSEERSRLTRDNVAAAQFSGSANPWPREVTVDEESRRLQDKADHLLEQTSSTVSMSSPEVSTQGLGSTLGSTLISEASVASSEAYRPRFTNPPPSDVPSRPRKPLSKEEDVLYQWRLRRRLETTGQREPTTAGKAAVTIPEPSLDSRLQAFRDRLSRDPTSAVPATKQRAEASKLSTGTDAQTSSVTVAPTFTPAPERGKLDPSMRTEPVSVIPPSLAVTSQGPCSCQSKQRTGDDKPTKQRAPKSSHEKSQCESSRSRKIHQVESVLSSSENEMIVSREHSEAESSRSADEDFLRWKSAKKQDSRASVSTKASSDCDENENVKSEEHDTLSDSDMIPEKDVPKPKPKEKTQKSVPKVQQKRTNDKSKLKHSGRNASHSQKQTEKAPPKGKRKQQKGPDTFTDQSDLNVEDRKETNADDEDDKESSKDEAAKKQRSSDRAQRRDVVMAPQRASQSPHRRGSPHRKLVTSAIGEVVRDHLSPSDSDNPAHDDASSHGGDHYDAGGGRYAGRHSSPGAATVQDSWDLVTVVTAPRGGREDAVEEERCGDTEAGPDESQIDFLPPSDEDFPDDELLMDLRRRREDQIRRLRALDAKLATLGGSDARR